jgi:integrase
MSKHMGIFEKDTQSGKRYQVKWRRADGSQAARTFKTLREAKDYKRHVEHEKSRGVLPDDRLAKVKFAEFAEHEVFPNLHHRPATIRRRDGIMKNHIYGAIGNTPISKITRTHILNMMRDWGKQGLSERSIINHLNVIRPVFNEALLRDIIVKSPMAGIRPPKPKKVVRNPLTPEQCHALLKTIDPRYVYAVEFVLATGVRWSEFADMEIRDFNSFGNSVSVRSSKTDAGVREIPLTPTDTMMIAKHIADTGRNGAHATSPLFTSPEGKPLHNSNFRKRIFRPACRAAGLEGVTFRDLRRTHATMLVAQGYDAKVVQERMGHKSISTTLAYYAMATEEARVKAAGAKDHYLATNSSIQRLAEAK